MTKKTPEGQVKSDIRVILDSLPKCWYFMPVAGFSVYGIPDVIGCYYGCFFVIEAKATAALSPRLDQRLVMAAIRRAGGLAIRIHKDNVGQLKNMLEHYRATMDNGQT